MKERRNQDIKTDWFVYVSRDGNPNLSAIQVNKRGEVFEMLGVIHGILIINTIEKINTILTKVGAKKEDLFTEFDFMNTKELFEQLEIFANEKL